MTKKQHIHLGHSPDADDAFMFYAIHEAKIPTHGYHFTHCIEDIESLNKKALTQQLEITAVSAHTYFRIHKHYGLLPSGASIGEAYGPLVITKQSKTIEELRSCRIAIPGAHTTAALVLQLCLEGVETLPMPFHKIMDAVIQGEVEAGLIIHEGQLVYQEYSLHKVLDLGKWWYQESHLPLPLGVNVIRRDLGTDTIHALNQILKASIQYAFAHEEEALGHAMQYAGSLSKEKARQFIHMYVNKATLDMGSRGLQALQVLLKRAHEKQIIPESFQIQYF